MDWSNEEYVKVCRRETDDDLILTWQARALWAAMLIKFDRAGLLETRRGVRGLAALVRIPLDVVQAVLPELLDDGRVLEVPLGYFSPNFLAAQEAGKSDKLRQRDSRARRAALAKSSALPLRGDVTNRDSTSRELAAGDEPDPGLALPPGDELDRTDWLAWTVSRAEIEALIAAECVWLSDVLESCPPEQWIWSLFGRAR